MINENDTSGMENIKEIYVTKEMTDAEPEIAGQSAADDVEIDDGSVNLAEPHEEGVFVEHSMSSHAQKIAFLLEENANLKKDMEFLLTSNRLIAKRLEHVENFIGTSFNDSKKSPYLRDTL